MAVTLLPDVEKFCVDQLMADADMAAVTDTRVYTIMPKSKETLAMLKENPFIVLSRIGGQRRPSTWQPEGIIFDESTVQFDCYASTKVLARTVMDTVRAVVPRWLGTPIAGSNAYISDAVEQLVGWMPDEDFTPYMARYLVEYRITTRAGSPG
jgi:hypothetical protein